MFEKDPFREEKTNSLYNVVKSQHQMKQCADTKVNLYNPIFFILAFWFFQQENRDPFLIIN